MKESKIYKEFRSLTILVIIAFLLKATLVEAYIVPTGSMENTIMTGDFLIGSRFVYGMRTPDWVGIPYTDIGFDIPYLVFPKFRDAKKGDIIIFKYHLLIISIIYSIKPIILFHQLFLVLTKAIINLIFC